MQYTAVAVVSGGLDSTTMLYDTVEQYGQDNVLALSFNYNQRHKVELDFARRSATDLDIDWHLIDLSAINVLLHGSALSDDSVDVPEGHYAWETMKQTVVPNRNSIMASVAIGACVASGAEVLRLGVHAGDHPVYPDCRPQFVEALQNLARVANEGFIHEAFRIDCPFLHVEKFEIAARAYTLGLPFHKTWSCYKGSDVHCGRCSTCVERIEAIALAGLTHTDETSYEDVDYWREVTGWGTE